MIRRLIRWAIYVFILLSALGVAAILSLDKIVKNIAENRLRAATGMDVTIGHIDVGLLTPTVTIDNFKLYNTPEFGGALFINMPELHFEYDPFAFRSGSLHFKLVRVNLAEIALVQDKKGRLNVQGLEKQEHKTENLHKKSNGQDLTFGGIDTLNLSLGKFRMMNLGTGQSEEIQFGITNQIFRNVKSEADLEALNVLFGLRATASTSSTNSVLNLPSLLNVLTGH